MSDPRVSAQARILVRYSTKVRKGEVVGIYCPVPAADLAEEIYKEVLRAGGIPLLRLSLPSVSPFFYREATDAQLDHVGPNDWAEAKAQSARIIVIAESNPRAMTSVPPERITRFQKARRRLKEYLLAHTRWSLTLHPTESMAQEAEMSLEEYRDFVYGSLFIGPSGDGAAAVRAWERHEREQNSFARRLRGSKTVRIVGAGTDLTLSVRGRKWIPSPGTHNLPSGEVFTAPVDDSAEGVVAFDCPTSMGGRLIEGMTLRFSKGRVVEDEQRGSVRLRHGGERGGDRLAAARLQRVKGHAESPRGRLAPLQ